MNDKEMALKHEDIAPQKDPVVVMDNISKNFGVVRALDNVSFQLAPNEIRAIVGENGAGKSTLMNILYGMYPSDEGKITLWGEEASENWSPRLAINKGIGMIHQHFSLIPNHTVLENIVMPTLSWKELNPQWKKFEEKIKQLCEDYSFKVNLKDRVEKLSIGEKQQVEILKALYQGAKVLILDEPTAVLTPQQAERLLNFLIQLKEQGFSVVIVTHKLDEVMAISDWVTVLRGGKHIATVRKKDTNPQEIARMMVERDYIGSVKGNEPPKKTKDVLRIKEMTVENEHGKNIVDNVSLTVGAGEILGIAGVAGNGQIQLAEALVGLRHLKEGFIKLDEQDATKWSINKRRQAGIGYIAEDRHSQAVVMDMTVGENMVLDSIGSEPYSRWGIVQAKEIDEFAEQSVKDYSIKTPGTKVPIRNLSGGNQQKVVLARTLSNNPKVILACQPSRGLDFSATEYVRKKLVECAKDGVGVLLISSDLDELLDLSHRIAVMYHGKIVGEFKRDEIDLDQLGLMLAGHSA